MENIKLEAGKFYRTRHDQKVFCLGNYPGIDADELMVATANGYTYKVNLAGVNISRPHSEIEPFDIIGEWTEPKRIKGWIALIASEGEVFPSPMLYTSQKDARTVEDNVVSCIEIDVPEGQGLDGSAR